MTSVGHFTVQISCSVNIYSFRTINILPTCVHGERIERSKMCSCVHTRTVNLLLTANDVSGQKLFITIYANGFCLKKANTCL